MKKIIESLSCENLKVEHDFYCKYNYGQNLGLRRFQIGDQICNAILMLSSFSVFKMFL